MYRYLFFFVMVALGCVSFESKIFNTWQAVEKNADLGPLALHQCLSIDEQILVYGGLRDDESFNPYRNQAAIFNLNKEKWRNLDIGEVLEPRFGAKVTSINKKVFFFGGRNKIQQLPSDAVTHDLMNEQWERLSPSSIDGRVHHSLTTVGKKAVVYGGSGHHKNLNWGYYDFEGSKWQSFPLPSGVKNRQSHIAIGYQNFLFIWGGFEDGRRVNSGYILDLAQNNWQVINHPGAPSPRANAKAVRIDEEVFVWGGASLEDHANTGAVYHLSQNRWRSMPPIPDDRYHGLKNPTFTDLGNQEILLWGGRFANDDFNHEGWVFHVKANRWSKLRQHQTPLGRMHHCIVSHEDKLFLFGGIGFKNSALTHFLTPWILHRKAKDDII